MTTSSTKASASPAPTEKKESLFQLTQELEALDAILTEAGGELTPEVQAWMAEYQGKLEGKVDAIGWFIRRCDAEEAAHKAHAQAMQQEVDAFRAKARTAANKRERIKEYVRGCLAFLGVTKLQGKAYSLGIEKTGGKRSIEIVEPFASHPELLPEPYQRVTVTAYLEAIRTWLEANPADESIARFLPQGDHVRLR